MTRPPVPGRSRGEPPPPWDDARVGAAYRAAFGRRAPAGLDREVFASVAAGRSPVRRSWRTSLPVLPGRLGRRGALAGVAVVLVATAGIAGLGGLAGIGPFADREDPPSGRFTLSAAPGGLVTLATADYAFELPADWLVYDAAGALGAGGFTLAILTNLPVSEDCGRDPIDAACALAEPLGPGDFRAVVGEGPIGGRRTSIFDQATRPGFEVSRHVAGGMPAIRDVLVNPPDTTARADTEVAWSIARPTSVTDVLAVELALRQPADAAGRIDAAIASLRFTPPPTPFPADDDAALTIAARAAIAGWSEAFRAGLAGRLGADDRTYLECFGPARGSLAEGVIHAGPEGDVGGPVEVGCAWDAAVVADAVGEVKLSLVWSTTLGEASRYFETLWIDAAGRVIGTAREGDPPPMGERAPGPTPATASPTPLPPPAAGVTFSIDLDDGVGPPTRVDVTDRSGQLVGARPYPLEGLGADLDIEPWPTALASPGDPRSIVIAWVGGPCDGLIRLAMLPADDESPMVLILDTGAPEPCDAMAVPRAVELTFDLEIDPSEIAFGQTGPG